MENQKKTINRGIQILRMIFSFNIVVFHCIDNKFQNIYIYFICRIAIYYYVPTFFLISFYFSYMTFTSRNIIKLKERLLRILIPYIIWPCIFWIKYSYIKYIEGNKEEINFKVLFHQLLIGKPFLPVFWFQFCLIFWSMLFIIIILCFKNFYKYIMTFLFILILCLNHFGFVYYLLSGNQSFFAISICDLFFRNIYMFTGFFFGSITILNRNIKFKSIIILLSYIGSIFCKYLNNNKKFDYIYTQFIINIIFIFSSILPFNLIKNRIIILIINQITSYTGGIYYLHYEIKHRTFNDIYLIKKGNFFSCIIIYLICYLFCFLSFKIFKKTKLKYLFI